MKFTVSIVLIFLFSSLIQAEVLSGNQTLPVSANRVNVEFQSSKSLKLSLNNSNPLLSGKNEIDFLPYTTRWLAMPKDASLSMSISNLEQSRHSSTDITTNSEIPVRNEWYKIGRPISSGGFDYYPITINNIVQDGKGFSVLTNAEFSLNTTTPIPVLNDLPRFSRELYGSLLLNKHSMRRDDGANYGSSRYIYVIPNDDDVSDILEPLFDYRLAEGFTLTEMRVNGWETAQSIQEDIQDLNDAGPPVEYVCLVGDVGGDYSVAGFIQGTSDYGYALMDNNDATPEAAVGRLSFNTLAQLEDIVDKITTYQENPRISNNALTRAALMAGSSRSGYSTILVNRWLRELMLDNGYADVDTFWYTMGHSTEEFIENAFEDGLAYFNYRGYTGLEDFTAVDAANLDNENLPVALLLACNSGDYTGRGAGITEALLRADGGAIGAIGTSGAQGRVHFNNALCAGFYRGIIEDDVYRLGWALNRAKMEMFSAYLPNEQDRSSDHAYWTNLMGDPGIVIWSKAPALVNIAVAERIATGQGSFDVTVTNAAGDAVSNARVGLYKEGEYSSAAYTNDEGVATFYFDAEDVSSGFASVAVTGKNILMSSEVIDFYYSPRDLKLQYSTVFDSTQGMTEGNGDEVPNPKEVIQWTIYVESTGLQSFQNGVNFELKSVENNYVDILDSVFTYEARIDEGDIVGAVFLLDINIDFPHATPVPFILTATAGNETWEFPVSLTGAAQGLRINNIALAPALQPGQLSNVTVRLYNLGSLDVPDTLVGTLSTESEYVSIVTNTTRFDTLFVNSQANGIPAFVIALEENTPYATSLPFILTLNVGDSSYYTSIDFELQTPPVVGTLATGPDEYGYYALEDTDLMSYNNRPTLNWEFLTEQLEGDGINTGMLDEGEDDDKSIVVDLPFNFQYYGEEFDQLTICTNGWAAFGDQRSFIDFRNLAIGSPQGPKAQLCPWWDDLYQPDANGEVSYMFDESGHRFIVEWYKMKRFIGFGGPGATETFQLILLDPEWHPNVTGDGDIIFQYYSVLPDYRIHMPNGTPYATIGIGDLEDRGGLQYAFWNQYSTGSRVIRNQMALKFTTSPKLRFAKVYGIVTKADDATPVINATVRVKGGGWVRTGNDGSYSIKTVVADRETAVDVRAFGFNLKSNAIEALAKGDSIEVNFSLTQPGIQVNLAAVNDTIGNQEFLDYDFTVSNTGNGRLDYSIDFEFNEAGEETLWGSLAKLNISDMTQDARILGVVHTGTNYFVSGGNNGNMRNNIYQLDEFGEYERAIAQPCEDLWGMHDLAWDGEYIYGGCRDTIYKFDTDGQVIATIHSPINPPRALAVNPANGDLWVGNEGAYIYQLSSEGHVLASYSNTLRPYGFTWWKDEDDQPTLFIFSADGENNLCISKLETATGTIVAVRDLELEDGDVAGGFEFSDSWDGLHHALVSIVQNPAGDRIEILNGGINSDQLYVTPAGGSLNANRSRNHELRIINENLGLDEYSVKMVIEHNAAAERVVVPIRVIRRDYVAVSYANIPTQLTISNVYPNPSNGFAQVEFKLPNVTEINIGIWDQNGRLVRENTSGSFSAGSHRVSFDVDDLSSGIYYIRLQTNGEQHYRKFVLLK